ncbi:MAG: hypothetical protein JEZ14_13970 [Marinilabiliaceae bacterium]|nr:hypothetical protein [Marinilabiliaceae bacterium]
MKLLLLLFIMVMHGFIAFGQLNTVEKRFALPDGYQRIIYPTESFPQYLRYLPLKDKGSKVHYYDGRLKDRPDVYCAVVDLGIGKRDLLQCADACMLLYGEYLFAAKQYDAIRFNFVSDGKPRFFKEYTTKRDYASFRKYMNYVFAYANTRSLHGQLTPVDNFQEMQPGDVLIQTGNPYGHAVIVVDMAEHPITGKKIYMLAQSYMPAQEIQILVNPQNPDLSPWYELINGTVHTPEWIFEPDDLRCFVR